MEEHFKETREILEDITKWQHIDNIISRLKEVCLKQQDEIEMLYEIIKRI